KTPPHGRLPDTSSAHDGRDPAPSRRASLHRRPHPPAALIQHTHFDQQAITLRDPDLIDHTIQFNITPSTPPLIELRALTSPGGLVRSTRRSAASSESGR